MSLARALTTRRKEDRAAIAPTPYIGRAASQRAPNARPIKRSEISLPVALISTTNMLSYEAPDIVDAPHASNLGGRYFSSGSSVTSSAQSDGESDLSGSIHSHETDATSVDMSSPDMSENHLSEFFKSSGTQRSTMSTTSSRVSRSTTHSSRPSLDSNSPRIPSRAPSHSKTAHMLSHKRSVQRMATIPADSNTRDSMDMFNVSAMSNPSAPTANPFGKELAQLTEAAEEFGHAVRDAEADADTQVMRSKGLVRFCANDYMSEISSLYSNAFEEDASMYQPMVWI